MRRLRRTQTDDEDLRVKGQRTETEGEVWPNRALAEALSGRQGQPLDAELRVDLEGAMGHSLAEVRLHRHATAATLAKNLGARALTVGPNVLLASGVPDNEMLAHEAIHVVQARRGPLRRGVSGPRDPSEEQARRTAKVLRVGEQVDLGSGPVPLIQRWDEEGATGMTTGERSMAELYWERRRADPEWAAGFHAEVDRRFWERSGYRVGERLDPLNPADRPYVRQWLEVRDEVMAEERQEEGGPAAGSEGEISFETAISVLAAVADILEGVASRGIPVVAEEEGGGFREITHPASHQDVPAEYQDALWDFFKAVRGIEESGGDWVRIRGARRQFWAMAGWSKIRPLLAVVRDQGDETAPTWIEENLHLPMAELLGRAASEEASEAVAEAGERLGAMLGPEQATQEEEAKALIGEAISALNDVAGLVNSVEGELTGEALQEIFEAELPPGAMADRIRDLSPGIAIGTLADVLASAKAIMELSDPVARARLFDERLGWMGHVRGTADVVANLLTITQGTVAAICLITAAASRAAGYADEATKLIGASRVVSGVLGKGIGALTIVKGTVSVVHPESRSEERASGVADIALGTAAIIGGAVGAGLTGAALSFKVNLELLSLGVEASRGIVWMGLSQCYRRMARDGEAIATFANRIVAGQALIDVETDEARKSHLMEAVETNRWLLWSNLHELITDAMGRGGNADPGTYRPLRERFESCGPPPNEDAPAAELIEQARLVLEVMQEAFTDVQAVLNESTRAAWEEHG